MQGQKSMLESGGDASGCPVCLMINWYVTFSGGGTDSQLLDINYFMSQLFYMELSNFNSLDIWAHICEDHFLNFLI